MYRHAWVIQAGSGTLEGRIQTGVSVLGECRVVKAGVEHRHIGLCGAVEQF